MRTHHFLTAAAALVAALMLTTAGDTVVFQGAAGSPSYSIQKQTAGGGWTTVCHDCTTDAEPGWHDPAASSLPGCYRLIGSNLDGLPGPASRPAGRCDQPTG